MNSDQPAGRGLRTFFIYLAWGVATFVVASAWTYVGLRLWGK